MQATAEAIDAPLRGDTHLGTPQALLAPALCHRVLAGTSLGVESAYQTLLGYSGPAARDPLQEARAAIEAERRKNVPPAFGARRGAIRRVKK
jgi:hypothetical protein